MQDVCFSWQLVFVGTLCTTLSSALSGLVGTARVLQAISLDFPAIGWLAKVSGDDGEPRRAVVVSYVVSQMTLFIGRVNDIAPVRQFHCASGLCKRAVQAGCASISHRSRVAQFNSPWCRLSGISCS
jgi:amino acid permease